MDTVRYYLALLFVVTMPGVYLYWFSIHPFVRFWRRVGAPATMAVHWGMIAAVGFAVFRIRREVLAVEFGGNYALIALAVPLLGLSVYLRRRLSKHFSVKMLLGLPEVAPGEYGGRLVTEGIYSQIRHPRYVQILVALTAYALIANYLATYVLLVAALVWAPLVARIEERELRDRFGRAYEEYCSQVPGFVPVFGTRPRGRPSE